MISAVRNLIGNVGIVLYETSTKRCQKAILRRLAQELLEILQENPYQNPPPYEKLVGDLTGAYSRRINIQHQLVYQIIEQEQNIKVLRLWSHYE